MIILFRGKANWLQRRWNDPVSPSRRIDKYWQVLTIMRSLVPVDIKSEERSFWVFHKLGNV